MAQVRDAAKGGCGLGGVCSHAKTVKTAKTAKTVKTVNGLEGRVASPVFPGPMSAVIAAGKKPPEPPKPSKPPKPSNATHPLDHTPPLQHLDKFLPTSETTMEESLRPKRPFTGVSRTSVYRGLLRRVKAGMGAF